MEEAKAAIGIMRMMCKGKGLECLDNDKLSELSRMLIKARKTLDLNEPEEREILKDLNLYLDAINHIIKSKEEDKAHDGSGNGCVVIIVVFILCVTIVSILEIIFNN